MYNVTKWRFRVNHCCTGNATMHCLSCRTDTINNMKTIVRCTTAFVATSCRCQEETLLTFSCKSTQRLCRVLTKFGVPRQIFIEVLEIEFLGNPPGGSRSNTCGWTDMKLVNTFRVHANAPKNRRNLYFVLKS